MCMYVETRDQLWVLVHIVFIETGSLPGLRLADPSRLPSQEAPGLGLQACMCSLMCGFVLISAVSVGAGRGHLVPWSWSHRQL